MWILSVLFFAVFLLAYIRHKLKYADVEKLPGPRPKWITGNTNEFGSTIVESFDASQRIIKEYGRVVRLWLGTFRLNLSIADPDMAEFFLSSQKYLKKSRGYDNLSSWLGQGLINSAGAHYKKHRKIITPAFHFNILDSFSEIFHRNLQILVERLKKEEGKSVDVCEPITLYAMDVLCETSMGVTSNCQINGENNYIKSAKGFLDIHIKRFFSFLNLYDFFFQFSPDYSVLLKHVRTMHKITEGMIEERKMRRAVDANNKSTKVLIDLLLNSPELSNEEIRSEADTFVFAGHDTVSATMSIGLYELAKHGDVQKKILEEIHDIVGEDRVKEIQPSQLREMSFLDRVVKEILRLYPAAPFIERQLEDDVVYKGMRIPAHSILSFQIYAQHRDPELFPDPEAFDPDRFLPENTINRHPFAYIPFSAGPRNCIGQKYAVMNLKTMIANIIRNFELHPADFPHVLIIGNNVILKFMNGLPIKLIYRK